MIDALTAALDRARQRRQLPDPEVARLLRRRAGLTLADVGRAVGVSHTAIWLWERSRRRPRDPQHVEAYSNLLDRLAREVGGGGGGA